MTDNPLNSIVSIGMFDTVLIANRGAIATRIISTLKRLNIRAVAVYHQQDAHSLHVQMADQAICLGDGTPADTYLNIEKILAAAHDSGAQAIHPGYGFLSENTEFVKACEQAGVSFIGPTETQINIFGLKHQARQTAEQADVPLVPGSQVLSSLDMALAECDRIGYPVMLKSSAGGGGIGMQLCQDAKTLLQAWDSVKRLSKNYFANDDVFVEKYIARGRHIEVQIVGDGQGSAVSFGERDCSAQRRNQKVIEETPAPNISELTRQRLHQTAERLMASVNYRNAGTVEFIYDVDNESFYFLEVNTRLQVEHGVTEQVWGIDLVELMVRVASGEAINLSAIKQSLTPKGHSVQARIYAENPLKDFQPSAGLLANVVWPEGFVRGFDASAPLRIDYWIESGSEVSALFDPMIAKVIVTKADRQDALKGLEQTLKDSDIYGIETNKDYVCQILNSETAKLGRLLTTSLAASEFTSMQQLSSAFEVLQPGMQTSIQDYPGRTGLWHIGVPPSGPMDNLNFRLANQLLGNSKEAAGLEITISGPTLKFHCAQQIVLTGGEIDAQLQGKNGDVQPLARYQVVDIAAGDVIKLGKLSGQGARAYLAVKEGIQCPEYLGSKATFNLGQFGGHVGRVLKTGDFIKLSGSINSSSNTQGVLQPDYWPSLYESDQTIVLRVIYGPHGAPDFFTDNDISTFFNNEWEVHYNSSRTGIRLIGPKPEWARSSGGEAGMHPSNIHDNAYAFGTVDFTGDMPVILGPDGPSLGGFVCPATVITADLWKLGQLRAGHKIRFLPVSHAQASTLEKAQVNWLQNPSVTVATDDLSNMQPIAVSDLASPIVASLELMDEPLICRLAGDHFLLLELGPLELDIARRFKIHTLMLWLEQAVKDLGVTGIKEMTPGIRSLQVHYDSQQCPLAELLGLIERACQAITQQAHNQKVSGDEKSGLTVPSRVVYLPLSWDDEACRLAIEKYIQSVRADAPWCPSNLEFIRRINGLESLQEVKDIVFDASYLVMGLGDVYLGAPVATPLDPRHRLVTTKYNPARTWTAENSVGIGGAYMCVYGMEGPGGYQFVGRTCQMWNTYHQTEQFSQPWLLRFFDQVRFYEVSAQELQQIRKDLPLGKHKLRIEEETFSLDQYLEFLSSNQTDISQFEQQRSQAFEEELQRWKDNGQLTYEQPKHQVAEQQDALPEDAVVIDSPVSGSVWQLLVEEGETVEQGQLVMILESMKMEIEIHATAPGIVNNTLVQQGQTVSAGQALLWLMEE